MEVHIHDLHGQWETAWWCRIFAGLYYWMCTPAKNDNLQGRLVNLVHYFSSVMIMIPHVQALLVVNPDESYSISQDINRSAQRVIVLQVFLTELRARERRKIIHSLVLSSLTGPAWSSMLLKLRPWAPGIYESACHVTFHHHLVEHRLDAYTSWKLPTKRPDIDGFTLGSHWISFFY